MPEVCWRKEKTIQTIVLLQLPWERKNIRHRSKRRPTQQYLGTKNVNCKGNYKILPQQYEIIINNINFCFVL